MTGINKEMAIEIYEGLPPEEKAEVLGESAMNAYSGMSKEDQAQIDSLSADLSIGLRRKMQEGGNPNVKIDGQYLKTKNLQMGEKGRITLLAAVAFFIKKQERISTD